MTRIRTLELHLQWIIELLEVDNSFQGVAAGVVEHKESFENNDLEIRENNPDHSDLLSSGPLIITTQQNTSQHCATLRITTKNHNTHQHNTSSSIPFSKKII